MKIGYKNIKNFDINNRVITKGFNKKQLKTGDFVYLEDDPSDNNFGMFISREDFKRYSKVISYVIDMNDIETETGIFVFIRREETGRASYFLEDSFNDNLQCETAGSIYDVTHVVIDFPNINKIFTSPNTLYEHIEMKWYELTSNGQLK